MVTRHLPLCQRRAHCRSRPRWWLWTCTRHRVAAFRCRSRGRSGRLPFLEPVRPCPAPASSWSTRSCCWSRILVSRRELSRNYKWSCLRERKTRFKRLKCSVSSNHFGPVFDRIWSEEVRVERYNGQVESNAPEASGRMNFSTTLRSRKILRDSSISVLGFEISGKLVKLSVTMRDIDTSRTSIVWMVSVLCVHFNHHRAHWLLLFHYWCVIRAIRKHWFVIVVFVQLHLRNEYNFGYYCYFLRKTEFAIRGPFLYTTLSIFFTRRTNRINRNGEIIIVNRLKPWPTKILGFVAISSWILRFCK